MDNNYIDKVLFLLSVQKRGILIYSSIISFFIILSLLFAAYFANKFAMQSLITPIVFGILFFVSIFLYIGLLCCYFKSCYKWHKDEYIMKNVTFHYSEETQQRSLRYFFQLIRLFLKRQNPILQECVYESDDLGKCCFILTRARAENLHCLFSADIDYFDYGLSPKRISSFSNLPVTVLVGKKHGYLKEILPQKDVEYSNEQMDLIRRFNEQSVEYRGYQNRQNAVLFFVPLLLCFGSFFIGAVISNICFVRDIPRTDYIIPVLLSFWLFLFAFISYYEYSINPKFGKYKSDISSNAFITESLALIESSIPVKVSEYFSCVRLHWFLRDKYAIFHQASYVVVDKNRRHDDRNVIYFVLTSEKMKLLHTLYSTTFQYDFGVRGNVILYDKETPLKITYGKQSRVLISIAPAEGYDYTEEQLAAIEKFNTLYP